MNLAVSSSPHIRGKDTTRRLMLDVIIALLPALIVGIVVFGMRALCVTLVTIVAAVAGEWLYRLITRQRNTVMDLSAVVTGMLLAMTLPATVPYWLAALGGLFATVVVKALCGGLGQNSFNPALAARALLLLAFPAWLTRYAAPGASLPLGGITAADVVTSATPLHHMQMPALPKESLGAVLLGGIGGSIGEVSALALLIGGVYLIYRKVISYRIPVAYLGSVAVLTLVFSKGDNAFLWMCYSLLSGGVMLGAVFMATDYATSPVAPKAQWVYGVGCGVLTVLFRYYGLYPEGVTYAILLMNAAVWLLDKWLADKIYGYVERKEEKESAWEEAMGGKVLLAPVLAILIAAAVLSGVSGGTRGLAKEQAQVYQDTIFPYLLPGSSTYTEETYDGEDENIRRVWKGETGHVIEATTSGYVDDITLWVGVGDDGKVTGLTVRGASETYGLGQRAQTDTKFLTGFLGTGGDAGVGTTVDALTGATVTSKAVTRAVNSAVGYVTGADVVSSASEWGG